MALQESVVAALAFMSPNWFSGRERSNVPDHEVIDRMKHRDSVLERAVVWRRSLN